MKNSALLAAGAFCGAIGFGTVLLLLGILRVVF